LNDTLFFSAPQLKRDPLGVTKAMLIPVEILLPIICGVATTPRAPMCSCIPPKGARSQVQLYMGGADFVFAGTVTEIKWKIAPLDSTDRDSRIMFRVAVMVPSTTWKGVVTDTVTVWTPDDVGACGFDFEEGQRYLVFAKVRIRSALAPDSALVLRHWRVRVHTSGFSAEERTPDAANRAIVARDA
jgi:hypothetical protein